LIILQKGNPKRIFKKNFQKEFSKRIFKKMIDKKLLSVFVRKFFPYENEKNFLEQIENFRFEDGNKITSDTALKELLGLMYKNNTPKLDSIYFERKSEYKFVWNLKSLDKSKMEVFKEILLALKKEEGINYIGKCKFCSSKELLAAFKQTRSSDEPATLIIRCVMCKKQWKE